MMKALRVKIRAILFRKLARARTKYKYTELNSMNKK